MELKGKVVGQLHNAVYNYYIDVYEKLIKPYLFPLSSMTEEQGRIYHELVGGMFGTGVLVNLEILIDWLNKNHFDYRFLIEKGLAIDATNLGIYK